MALAAAASWLVKAECPLGQLLAGKLEPQSAAGMSNEDVARVADVVIARLGVKPLDLGKKWINVKEINQRTGRSRGSIYPALRAGTLHDYDVITGYWAVKVGVDDAWMQARSVDEQREICGCA